MCGVAGYMRLAATVPAVEPSLLEAMQGALAHRGPDGYRMWVDHERGVGLVHRRLSIVDCTDAAFQPMSDMQQTVLVCCNGEIYNHRALRIQLESLGHVYRTNSDTETIIHAYKQWGIACLEKLQGMFAVALFDVRANELYLIRDRIGVKPLYFSLQNKRLSFASELTALWQLPWVSKTINPRAFSHYLTFLATPAPMTLYKQVYKLPAGYYCKIDRMRQVTFMQWYDVLSSLTQPVVQPPLTHEMHLVGDLTRVLRHSVAKRMMADVPVGAFLSGGLDSSLLVALMAEQGQHSATFTISFTSAPEQDERVWARKVAERFDTEHHELIVDEQQAYAACAAMMRHQDEPIGDRVCLPLYLISREAHQAGIRVILTGEGADELFCGYDMYVRYLAWNGWWSQSQGCMPAAMRALVVRAARYAAPRSYMRASLLQNWADGYPLFWGGAIAFPELFKREIMHELTVTHESDPILAHVLPQFDDNGSSYEVVRYYEERITQRVPTVDLFTRMRFLELKHRLPELLLTRLDKMMMAHGVEGRVPYLDPDVVAYALRIPGSVQYQHGVTKYLLKKVAEQFLPASWVYRSKMGFAAPTAQWFRAGTHFKQDFIDRVCQLSSSPWSTLLQQPALEKLLKQHEQDARVDYSYQLWALYTMMAHYER